MLFILGTPAIWAYALVPTVVLLILACGLGGLGIWAAVEASEVLLGEPANGWAQAGGWLLTVLLALTALFIALLLALVLTQPLCGFALEKIVLARERAILGYPVGQASFLQATLVSVRVTLVTLAVAVVVFALLLGIDFVLPPLAIVTVPLKFVIGGWLLAWNFLDYPLSLRGYGLRARLAWAWEHFDEFTAFGLVWALLLPIPGLVLIVLPMGVAGAAQLVVATERADAARPMVLEAEYRVRDE